MSEYKKTSKQKSDASTQDQTDVSETVPVKNEELEEDVNDLLDEIDDVLEENAEQFVKDFVQRGGE